jgi:hypothetical protein
LEIHAVSSTSTLPPPGNVAFTVTTPFGRVTIRTILKRLFGGGRLVRTTVYVVVPELD